MVGRSSPGAVLRVLALAALALAAAAPAGAQAEARARVRDDSGMGSDAEAIHAYALAGQECYTKAREIAERLLQRRPDSFEAHFLKGYTLHLGEASLPRAYHHLKRARELFEKQHGAHPPATSPWRWHLSTLEELASVTREMDRFEEALALLDAHDTSYDPDDVAARGWPLMRLRRYDEARAIVARALASKDQRQQQIARTTLCAIEAELQRRRPAYDACLLALRAEPEAQAGPHLFTNAASSALSVLKPDEAEKLLLEGTSHFELGNAANPWQDLTLMYLDHGRTGEALSAMREMVAWFTDQPPYMDEQTRAGIDFTASLFLLVAGRGEEAVHVTERILSRPDRTGFTSAESAQGEAANAILSRAALRLLAERKLEEAAATRGLPSWKAWGRAQQLRFEAWQSGRRASRLVADQRMLVSTLRPFLPGGVSVPTWMTGELVDLLGPGVVAAALDEARKVEDLPGAAAYLDALGAEAALGRGRTGEARQLAERALAALGRTEVLLQARVAVVAARALQEDGDAAGAVALYTRALQQDPGVVRRLSAALPVRIVAAPDVVSRAVAERLHASPRLDVTGAGMLVEVRSAGGGAEACLRGPNGENLGCGGVARGKPGDGVDVLAEQVVRAFHEQVFAARIDLTQADLRSLDGSTTVGRERSEEKQAGVLEDLGLPGPEGAKKSQRRVRAEPVACQPGPAGGVVQ